MMLIDIGFRPNNLFVSNASKHFPTNSQSYAQISHEINTKSRPIFFNSKKKKLFKKSLSMPYPEEGAREGKAAVLKCLDASECHLDRLETRHRFFNHPKCSVSLKGKVPSTEAYVGNGNRLAVEFPMILSLGSAYSSHVILYLDP